MLIYQRTQCGNRFEVRRSFGEEGSRRMPVIDNRKMKMEGWKLASVTSGAHLKRILEMCEELGFDVYTEEVTPEECGGCTTCYVAGNETITRIYTKSITRKSKKN